MRFQMLFMKHYWSLWMMKNKVLQTLGLAQRAGKIVTGDELLFKIDKRKVSLVLLASNASQRTQDEILKKCEAKGMPCLVALSKEELSNAIGKFNRVAVGITDAGFSKLLKSYLENRGE